MTVSDFEEERLAYLSDAAIPSREANSIQTIKMCEAFAKQGLEVTLFIPNRPTDEDDDPYEFYDVDRCFEIVRIPWKPGERYLFSLLVPFYVRRFDPDIVFGRFVPACFFTALLGYRVVIESHSPVSETQRPIAWMFRTLLRLNRLEHLIVISGALRDHYLLTYDRLSPDDVTVAHDAASEPPDDVESFPFADSDRLQVGYVGHLYEGKGMGLIAELIPRCPWADFHIVGGTEEDIERWEHELEEYENVEFYGFVPPSAVARYQLSMDVLLAPYQKQVYGSSGETDLSQWMSPLKLFEYMAAGKVILCSDLPVLREVVTDRENAILCDPDDVSAWATKLSRICDESNIINKLGSTARDDFETRYTYSSRAEFICSILTDC